MGTSYDMAASSADTVVEYTKCDMKKSGVKHLYRNTNQEDAANAFDSENKLNHNRFVRRTIFNNFTNFLLYIHIRG